MTLPIVHAFNFQRLPSLKELPKLREKKTVHSLALKLVQSKWHRFLLFNFGSSYKSVSKGNFGVFDKNLKKKYLTCTFCFKILQEIFSFEFCAGEHS